jgi:hypothetical protein
MKKLVFILTLAFSLTLVKADDPQKEGLMKANSYQIGGTVIDHQTGEALVGVALKLKGTDTKIYSDLNGNFEIKDLPSGTYDIEVDYVSYKDITLKEVSTLSSEVNIKVELEPVTPSF